MLKIKNLTVKYEKTILENVNLKLDKKIYGLMGMTGSGKTTFTKALCKRLDPTKVNLLETDPYIIGKPRGLVVPKDLPDQKVTACLSSAHELASLERDIRAL